MATNYSDSIARDVEFSPIKIYSSEEDEAALEFALVSKNFSGLLRGGEEITIEYENNVVIPYNNCKKFEIIIFHTDLLDIRRSTTITGRKVEYEKFRYTYSIEEETEDGQA